MIRLKNFHLSHHFDEAVIKRVITTIPSRFLVGLDNIIYDPTRFNQRSYIQPGIVSQKVKGQYCQILNANVYVYQFDNVEQLAHIICHEIGHHIFQNILTLKQKQLWASNFKSQTRFVTDYARTSVEEDFCETFAVYILNPNRVRRDTSRHLLIKNI